MVMIVGTATSITRPARRFAHPIEVHGLIDGYPFRLTVPHATILREGDVVGLVGTPLDGVFTAHVYANATTGAHGSAAANLLWGGLALIAAGLVFGWLVAPIVFVPAGLAIVFLGLRRRQRARQLQEWTREFRKTGARPNR